MEISSSVVRRHWERRPGGRWYQAASLVLMKARWWEVETAGRIAQAMIEK